MRITIVLILLRLMDKILRDPKDPKLWELWYIPYYGSCRILSISRNSTKMSAARLRALALAMRDPLAWNKTKGGNY